MQYDRAMLKKPQFWAVIVPAILSVWAIGATAKMFKYRSEADYQIELTSDSRNNARSIASVLKRAGRYDLLETSLYRSFNRVTSARQCAKAAAIPESQLYRGESSKPKQQKDGSFLHRENFHLNSVRLIQIAKFIDYAEQNYTSLICTGVTIAPARKKSKDSWDATINFQYLK